jgi:hypothetical protein
LALGGCGIGAADAALSAGSGQSTFGGAGRFGLAIPAVLRFWLNRSITLATVRCGTSNLTESNYLAHLLPAYEAASLR